MWPKEQQFVQVLQNGDSEAVTDLAVLCPDLLLSHVL